MKTVYFYLLQEETPRVYTRSVCTLIEKLYHQQLFIYLHCDNADISQQWDDDLWTFRDIGFVPHQLSISVDVNALKVPLCLIGHSAIILPQVSRSVLFNVASDIPNTFSNYSTIIEVVPADQAARANSRLHYKQYQASGYKVETKTYEEN